MVAEREYKNFWEITEREREGQRKLLGMMDKDRAPALLTSWIRKGQHMCTMSSKIKLDVEILNISDDGTFWEMEALMLISHQNDYE
ncbi:unnamed protein product [Sphenostylis stenocarpa]|uniref:Uncharacterized protein n=1 Tax=Sphenostylis stenocarpa TaxID=92480 RepID=A0AA86SGD5_9FABA|nr:unnamed protein product [Sphenostylis stenocarpa]